MAAMSKRYGQRLAAYTLMLLCFSSGCFNASTSMIKDLFVSILQNVKRGNGPNYLIFFFISPIPPVFVISPNAYILFLRNYMHYLGSYIINLSPFPLLQMLSLGKSMVNFIPVFFQGLTRGILANNKNVGALG